VEGIIQIMVHKVRVEHELDFNSALWAFFFCEKKFNATFKAWSFSSFVKYFINNWKCLSSGSLMGQLNKWALYYAL
jgi:hypothetical protein